MFTQSRFISSPPLIGEMSPSGHHQPTRISNSSVHLSFQKKTKSLKHRKCLKTTKKEIGSLEHRKCRETGKQQIFLNMESVQGIQFFLFLDTFRIEGMLLLLETEVRCIKARNTFWIPKTISWCRVLPSKHMKTVVVQPSRERLIRYMEDR